MLVQVPIDSVRVEKPAMIGQQIRQPGEILLIGNGLGQIPEERAAILMKTHHVVPILPSEMPRS